MRKIVLVALFAVAVAGFALTSSAAILDLVFTPTGVNQFSVDATTDMDYAVVNFGVRPGNTHTFNPNTTNFALTSSSTSTTGDTFHFQDKGVIAPCASTGCYHPGDGVINVGTYLGALAGQAPYNAETESAGKAIFWPTGGAPAGGYAAGPDPTAPSTELTLRITIVPEPTSIVLLGASLAGLAFLRRRPA